MLKKESCYCYWWLLRFFILGDSDSVFHNSHFYVTSLSNLHYHYISFLISLCFVASSRTLLFNTCASCTFQVLSSTVCCSKLVLVVVETSTLCLFTLSSKWNYYIKVFPVALKVSAYLCCSTYPSCCLFFLFIDELELFPAGSV